MSESNDKEIELRQQVEALLFSCGRAINPDEISALCHLKNNDGIVESLKKIKEEYQERNSPIMIVEENGAWKMTVREKYLHVVQRINPHTEFSRSTMETLAVVAWKSPVLQSEIIKIRSTKGYDHIKELVELGFISKEKQGRSFVLKTTQKFYDYFDLAGKEGVKKVFGNIPGIEMLGQQMKSVTEYGIQAPTHKLGALEIYDLRNGKDAEKFLDPNNISIYEMKDDNEVDTGEGDKFEFDVKGADLVEVMDKEEDSLQEPTENEEPLPEMPAEEPMVPEPAFEPVPEEIQPQPVPEVKEDSPMGNVEKQDVQHQEVGQEIVGSNTQTDQGQGIAVEKPAFNNNNNFNVEHTDHEPMPSTNAADIAKAKEEQDYESEKDTKIARSEDQFDPDQQNETELNEVYERVDQIESESDNSGIPGFEDSGNSEEIRLGPNPIEQAAIELEGGVQLEGREKSLYEELTHGEEGLSFMDEGEGKNEESSVKDVSEEEEISKAVKEMENHETSTRKLTPDDEKQIDALLKGEYQQENAEDPEPEPDNE